MTAAPPRSLPSRRDLALAGLGGTVGAGLRLVLVLAWPARGVDLTILTVNVGGAFLLGALLTWLAGLGPDRGRRRDVRLLVGTGVLGGFTTYSTLAVDTATLVRGGQAGTASAYGLGTLCLGAAASLAGIRVAGLLLGRRGALSPAAATDEADAS